MFISYVPIVKAVRIMLKKQKNIPRIWCIYSHKMIEIKNIKNTPPTIYVVYFNAVKNDFSNILFFMLF